MSVTNASAGWEQASIALATATVSAIPASVTPAIRATTASVVTSRRAKNKVRVGCWVEEEKEGRKKG